MQNVSSSASGSVNGPKGHGSRKVTVAGSFPVVAVKVAPRLVGATMEDESQAMNSFSGPLAKLDIGFEVA